MKNSKEIAKNGKKEEECEKKHDKPVAMQDHEGNDSDEDLRQKAVKLSMLKKEASKEVSASSGSKNRPPNKGDCQAPAKSLPSSSSSLAAEKSEWTSHEQLQVFTSRGVAPHRKVGNTGVIIGLDKIEQG